MSDADIVRASFAAFRAQDEAAAREIVGDPFVFTSPQDDGIDRDAWFARCFPQAGRFVTQDLEHVVEVGGGDVLAVYSYELTDGARFRNAELLSVRGGRITEVQVFFGGRIG